jgi:hypothetical protein
MKTTSFGKAYSLEELEKTFGLKRLNRHFAGLELFRKDEQLLLFKPQGPDTFIPFPASDGSIRSLNKAS